MPIPLLPPISTVFAPILASPVFTGQPAYQKKLEQVLLAAAEAEALLAPIIKYGVSWNTISQTAFNELATLEAQGVIPTNLTPTIATSLNTVNVIQASATQLVNATNSVTAGNLNQGLSSINTISRDLAVSTASLYGSLNVLNDQAGVVNATAPGIQNTPTQVLEVFKGSQGQAAQNLAELNKSIVFVSSSLISAQTQNLLTGNSSQTAEAQKVLNDVTSNIAQVTSIANNLNSTIGNIQSIANNLKSFNGLNQISGKRKPRKVLYPLPSFLNPANNTYVRMYGQLNTIIASANSAISAIEALGSTVGSLDIF